MNEQKLNARGSRPALVKLDSSSSSQGSRASDDAGSKPATPLVIDKAPDFRNVHDARKRGSPPPANEGDASPKVPPNSAKGGSKPDLFDNPFVPDDAPDTQASPRQGADLGTTPKPRRERRIVKLPTIRFGQKKARASQKTAPEPTAPDATISPRGAERPRPPRLEIRKASGVAPPVDLTRLAPVIKQLAVLAVSGQDADIVHAAEAFCTFWQATLLDDLDMLHAIPADEHAAATAHIQAYIEDAFKDFAHELTTAAAETDGAARNAPEDAKEKLQGDLEGRIHGAVTRLVGAFEEAKASWGMRKLAQEAVTKLTWPAPGADPGSVTSSLGAFLRLDGPYPKQFGTLHRERTRELQLQVVKRGIDALIDRSEAVRSKKGSFSKLMTTPAGEKAMLAAMECSFQALLDFPIDSATVLDMGVLVEVIQAQADALAKPLQPTQQQKIQDFAASLKVTAIRACMLRGLTGHWLTLSSKFHEAHLPALAKATTMLCQQLLCVINGTKPKPGKENVTDAVIKLTVEAGAEFKQRQIDPLLRPDA